jgi:hypothetical protein
MKLVGGDSGRVEREQFVETVILAPSERIVVDVHVREPGKVSVEDHDRIETREDRRYIQVCRSGDHLRFKA